MTWPQTMSDDDANWLKHEFDVCLGEWRTSGELHGSEAMGTRAAFERMYECARIITRLGVMDEQFMQSLVTSIDPRTALHGFVEDELGEE